jgi:hypothetical protein
MSISGHCLSSAAQENCRLNGVDKRSAERTGLGASKRAPPPAAAASGARRKPQRIFLPWRVGGAKRGRRVGVASQPACASGLAAKTDDGALGGFFFISTTANAAERAGAPLGARSSVLTFACAHN